MFLSWLWQFNSFLWGIGFLSEVGESVGEGWMPLVGERKEGRTSTELWKLSSFILTTLFYIQVASKMPSLHSPFLSTLWCVGKAQYKHLVSHKSMTLGQKVVLRSSSYWQNILYVLYEPQLCELPISYNAMNVKMRLWKFTASNFSHVSLDYNFLVSDISWWHVCAVSINPTACGMRKFVQTELHHGTPALLTSDHIP